MPTCGPELGVGSFHCGSPLLVWFGVFLKRVWFITVCWGGSLYLNVKLKSICLCDHPQRVLTDHSVTFLLFTPMLRVLRFLTISSILIRFFVFITFLAFFFVRFLLFGITWTKQTNENLPGLIFIHLNKAIIGTILSLHHTQIIKHSLFTWVFIVFATHFFHPLVDNICAHGLDNWKEKILNRRSLTSHNHMLKMWQIITKYHIHLLQHKMFSFNTSGVSI